MIINNNINTFADIVNTGITSSILNINLENLEINKMILVNQIENIKNNDELIRLLKIIIDNQEKIINNLEEQKGKIL